MKNTVEFLLSFLEKPIRFYEDDGYLYHTPDTIAEFWDLKLCVTFQSRSDHHPFARTYSVIFFDDNHQHFESEPSTDIKDAAKDALGQLLKCFVDCAETEEMEPRKKNFHKLSKATKQALEKLKKNKE